ncbi:HNH endonuclease [Cohnella suwonensis]|uniref:HNH endonuclease n=1 Tax=Cohnella suwonensis TaxID=696072 RepID=A0ABW0LRT6_9BACL
MTNNIPFRESHPSRTCTTQYTDHKRFKPHLRVDFNQRCGYCHANDIYLGGATVFHVDHFAPQKKFPDLRLNYSNLVYSCPYCNRSKSDDWPSTDATQNIANDKGYIDPCGEEYVNNFCRDPQGNIVPLSPVGIYMHKRLRFGLRRHQILWIIHQIRVTMNELHSELEKKPADYALLTQLASLNKEYLQYWDYITDNKANA